MKHITRLRKICKEIEHVENYNQAAQDNFHGWILHHRLELTLENEQAHTAEELIRLNMYYDRPYFELIFMKRSEHTKLHNIAKGKAGLYETRKCKISESVKRAYKEGRINVNGQNNPMYGKTPWNKGKRKPKVKKGPTGFHVCSEETKMKIAEAKRKYWENKKKRVIE